VEIVLQTNWGWLIGVYLFLGGLAAGALFVVSILNLSTGDRFKNTIRFRAWAAVVALILGVLSLLLEVGVPLRAMILTSSFVNFNSWMAVGAWLLILGILCSGLYALSNTDWIITRFGFLSKWRSILAMILIPLSLGIALYTGVLLSVLWARPVWNTWFLPTLFTLSALSTGLALICAYFILRGPKTEKSVAHVKRLLEITASILVVFEGAALGGYLGSMSASDIEVASRSAEVLTSGSLSLPFWIIIVGLGLCLPLLVSLVLVIRGDLAQKTWNILPMVGILSCMAGGFTLRILVLLIGLPIYS